MAEPLGPKVAVKTSFDVGKVLRTYGIVLALLILVVLVTLQNDVFLSATNLRNLLSQWAPAGIMAVGMTYVILTGGFDLSVGSAFSMCAIVAAGLARYHDPWVAITAAVAVGIVIGFANGVLVVYAKINPFISTLGTSFVITGLSILITGNRAYIVNNPAFSTLGKGRILGIPYSGILLILFLVIGGLVLAKTVYGRSIYAVGGNLEASRLSGLPTGRIVLSSYVISGGCAGVAGAIIASQLASAQPNIDPTIVFDVITIVVVGGTSLSGGYGAMWRTAVGIGIVATIDNGIVILGIDPSYRDITKGMIIIGALALDSYLNRNQSFLKSIERGRLQSPELPTELRTQGKESQTV